MPWIHTGTYLQKPLDIIDCPIATIRFTTLWFSHGIFKVLTTCLLGKLCVRQVSKSKMINSLLICANTLTVSGDQIPFTALSEISGSEAWMHSTGSGSQFISSGSSIDYVSSRNILLQRCPGSYFSSHEKRRPFALLSWISLGISFLTVGTFEGMDWLVLATFSSLLVHLTKACSLLTLLSLL